MLSNLPSAELSALSSHLKPFPLKLATVLQEDAVEIEHVYFPTSGLVSVLVATAGGELIETALIGKEGLVNSFAGMGVRFGFNRAVVQVCGDAYRIETAPFVKAIRTLPMLRERIDRYHAFLLIQAQQAAACNILHPIEARLCRWLAQVRDRVGSDTFDITQEFLAQMLGVSRPTVNLALSQLKAGNLIRTHRRAIEVVDPEGLKASACECHAFLKAKLKDIV